MSNPEQKLQGACYAYALAFSIKHAEFLVCHGVATNNKPDECPGVKQGHAWNEVWMGERLGWFVVDVATNTAMMERAEYYRQAGIDPRDVIRYEAERAWELGKLYDHCGPFDTRTKAAWHTGDPIPPAPTVTPAAPRVPRVREIATNTVDKPTR